MSTISQDSAEGSIKTTRTNQNGREGVLNDNPSSQITTVKLDGSNYLNWSWLAILSIQSRGYSRYLIENSKKPEENDPLNDGSKKSLVISWLLHSMSPI